MRSWSCDRMIVTALVVLTTAISCVGESLSFSKLESIDGRLIEAWPEQSFATWWNESKTYRRKLQSSEPIRPLGEDVTGDLLKRRKAYIKKPTPPSKPEKSLRKKVEWFEGSHSYALRASVDSRLLIRHSPYPADGSPWPMPQMYFPEPVVFGIRPTVFKIYSAGEDCDILTYAFSRIRRNTFGDDPPQDGLNTYPFTELRHLNVTVLKECTKYPSLESDESYDLEVKRSGASIIAREVWGALRALETFSQLVFQDEDGTFYVNKTSIHDFPRFPHRGILLDTARHYLNKDTIIENLEAMAQNKMNVFHWHIVDDQSFPFQSKTFPNLTEQGAYDPVTHVYTHEDIMDIIEEARYRGIRVIPEFDTPGHTFAWGLGQEYLLTPCYDYTGKADGFFGPINPILKSTYSFLYKLFNEVFSIFPDKYVHLGGDEVPFDCWTSNPQIMSFIRRNNLTDVRDVLSLYERKLLDLVSKLGKTRDNGSGYIVWQEVVDNGVKVKPDTIVQVWMGDSSDIERITSMGLRVLFSSCWYLDYINYGMDWDKYYRCEQMSHLDEYRMQNESLLIGGEACLWTEYADDESVIPRLWPRASATAERLWSNKKVKDEVAAAPRIEAHRCRMIRRGVRAGVLAGPGYCKDPNKRVKKKSDKNNVFWSSTLLKSIRREEDLKSHSPQIYVVDLNSLYLVPVLIVICICCVTLISLVHQESKNKVVAMLTYPMSINPRMSVRTLVVIFLAFAAIWCIWTAPIWMNSWESSHRRSHLVDR